MKEVISILNENRVMLENISQLIIKAEKIAIIGHINPDGDCIGSQLGLYYALKSIGKNADLINGGKFKGNLKDQYEHFFINSINTDYDLFIIVDVSNRDRLGELQHKIDYSKTIVIDHHITNCNFGSVNWVSGIFVSASEMIFLLLYKMDINFKSNINIAQNLLNGVLSDNGFYQHIRVNKSLSLLLSYLLIERGGDPNKSFELMFCNKDLSSLKIFSLVLARVTPLKSGRILWSYLTENDKDQYGCPDFESASLFTEMKSTSNFEVGIFFKINEKEERVDISFRSIDSINVAELANELGGGGHKVAAGVSLYGKFDDIKNMILEKTVRLMEKNN
jgi:bifunctional oligoribonuclease and PAP phosphatase NrnA